VKPVRRQRSRFPPHDRIHGQRDRVELGRLAPLDHRPVQALILVRIELEEFGRFDRRADLLDADGRQARNAEPGAEPLRRRADRTFALPMEQPLQRGGREEERHRHLAPHQRRAHVDLFDAREHARHQVAIFERGGVTRLGDLVVGSAVDIVEHRPGQPFAGQAAEILSVVAVGQAHRPSA
jgi:hypothetical protein